MHLEEISANIRHRNAWEGLDLGFVMARHWFLPLWGLWWITAAPVLLLAVGSYWWHGSLNIVAIVVWWFKPLFEPMLLYWLSRRLFGEQLSVSNVVGAWRKVLLPRLLANLTLFRLSPNRSFFMPVSLLEGLKGVERRKRLNVLRGSQSAGTWLTIVGAHIEVALYLGCFYLLLFLIPDALAFDDMLQIFRDDESWVLYSVNLFWLLAMSLFAPFYVAAGFALYLTRRSQLEAWDLELAFRRMEPRFKGKKSGLRKAVVTLLPLLLLLLPLSNNLTAATLPTPSESQQIIGEVLAEDDFGVLRLEEYWRYIGEEDEPERDKSSLGWVKQLADVLEFIFWAVVIIGAVVLIVYLSRLLDWLPERNSGQSSEADRPEVLFGMPITPESLPDDVPAAIRAQLESGAVRPALSLLYRATLARMVHQHRLRIPDSATEGECNRLVATSRPVPEADYFDRLTGVWIRCAYGHFDPQKEHILDLVETWQGLQQEQGNG